MKFHIQARELMEIVHQPNRFHDDGFIGGLQNLEYYGEH